MRTRVRDTQTTEIDSTSISTLVPTNVWGYSYLPTSQQVLPDIPNPSNKGEYSLISDELVYRKLVGNVDHQKAKLGAIPPLLQVVPTYGFCKVYKHEPPYGVPYYWYPWQRSTYNHAGHSAYALVNYNGPWFDYAGGDASTLVGSRSDDRLGELAPKIVQKIESLNLANTAYEARELPTLWRMFGRREALYRNLNRIQRRFQGFRSNNPRSEVFRDFFRSFRDGTLNYEFGMKPTIGDLRKVAEELKRQKRKNTRSFSVSVKDDSTTSRFHSGTNPSFGHYSATEKRVVNRVFGCRVQYAPPGSDVKTDFIKKWGEWEQRLLGVNPARIIWDAIPFSFAVDWLLSIDSLLDALWVSNYPGISTEYWSSVRKEASRVTKYQYVEGSEIEGVEQAPWSSSDPNTSLILEYGPDIMDSASHYNRSRRDAPSALSSLKVRGGIKQIYLLLLISLGLRKK